MADDETTTDETTTETVATDATHTGTSATADETTADTRGGRGAIPFPRFKEVIDERNALRERAAAAERDAQVLREQQQKQAQAQAPKHYTAAELQGYVDAGRITPATMAEQLAWQHAQRAKQEWQQESQQQSRMTEAQDQVQAYIQAVPVLNDRTSPEYLRAAREAQALSARLGLSVDNPVVQELALRLSLGALDKLAKTRGLADHAREASETVETGGGGGSRETTGDPLKGVSREQMAFWTRLGYSKERMIAEAKYIPAHKRTG